jgi:uracil-DNA glycosylase family 4
VIRPPADDVSRRELARLEVEIALCERCFGAEPRLPVRFARKFGSGSVLVWGECPSRRILESGERLGPDNDDAGTRFLREMLEVAEIPEEEVILGASTLCRPRSRDLERAVPGGVRLRECAAHVRELVCIVQPRLILPLGATALRSLRITFPAARTVQTLRFPGSVGVTVGAGRTWIHPLYHTTVRARVTRPKERQRKDWKALAPLWEWIAAGERGAPAVADPDSLLRG